MTGDIRERKSGVGSVDSDDFNAVVDAIWEMQSVGVVPEGHLTQTSLSSAQILALHTDPVMVEAGAQGKIIVPLSVFFEHIYGTAPYANAGNSSLLVYAGGLPDPTQGMWTGGTVDALSQSYGASTLHYLQSGWSMRTEYLAGEPLMVKIQEQVTGGDGSAVLTVAWFYATVG